MGTEKFKIEAEKKLKMTMMEFSNIIVGNLGILLSDNFDIHIDLSPPTYLKNRHISKQQASLQTLSIQLLLFNKVETYKITIMRTRDEYVSVY